MNTAEMSSEDVVLMSDILLEVQRGWSKGFAKAWSDAGRPEAGEGEATVGVILLVPVSLWDRADPIVREVVTRLAFVESVEPLALVGDPEGTMRGWRIQCRRAF